MSERCETCQTCKFWEDVGEDADGLCRRFPPVLNVIHLADDVWAAQETNQEEWNKAKRVSYLWAQPVTDGGDWCGEHQPKPEKADE